MVSLVAPVAQLDRAPGFEPVGRRFNSCRAHHSFNELAESSTSTYLPGYAGVADPTPSQRPCAGFIESMHGLLIPSGDQYKLLLA
jgi:hypothetical protein